MAGAGLHAVTQGPYNYGPWAAALLAVAVSTPATVQHCAQVQHGSCNAVGKRRDIHACGAQGGMQRIVVHAVQYDGVCVHAGAIPNAAAVLRKPEQRTRRSRASQVAQGGGQGVAQK